MRANKPETASIQAAPSAVALSAAELANRPAVSIDETAAFLGLHSSTVRGAVAAGDIPSFKVGRRILVPTASLLKLVGAA
jgi:excisionase family DNA binding protein